MTTTAAAELVAGCTGRHIGDTAPVQALVRLLDHSVADVVAEDHDTAARLIALARRYGRTPFAPLETVRQELTVDRTEFTRLLELFSGVRELREAVLRGPAGKYWTNTVLPLERTGALDDALAGRPRYPTVVGLYPGPTCMFRCHFCVRVTGERYDASSLVPGTRTLEAIVDGAPAGEPGQFYVSGGLEPLTNPHVGALVSRAAARGFRITMYTNAFALNERTLERQPGLWDLHAVRTSLYGLSDAEYEATVAKAGAFRRVADSVSTVMRLRAQRDSPIRIGFNYLVLPGRAGRLLELADFLVRLSEATPGRSVDFLNLRQDYSGRDDGRLDDTDKAELADTLAEFDRRIARNLPELDVDYGYALHSFRAGVPDDMIRIRSEDLRPTAHPQVAVQVDLLGDVYLYREAGFPGLPGADRYIAGRVGPDREFSQVVDEFVTEGRHVAPRTGDEYFLDGFDQVVTSRLRQVEADVAAGWGRWRGFLR